MMTAEALVVNMPLAPVKKLPVPGLKVSAVIITLNEERIIQKTLSKLYWCDEIVIVDSGSTDNTIAICEQFGCTIYSRRFDGYGPQKQFAVSMAKNDWILCIDADEVLTDNLIKEILSSLRNDAEYAGFSFPMNMVFLNKEFTFGKESGRYFLRLFNRNKGGFNNDKVHEGIQLNGPIKKMNHIIQHYSYSSISQYLEKLNRYSTYSAEMAFKKGKNKSLLAVLLAIPYNFFKYYLLERNFMNGSKGFYWSVFSAWYHFAKYLKIKELNQTNYKKQIASSKRKQESDAQLEFGI
jgi:glycosyltransferase involved in cell wall biosynthesis